MVLQIILQTSPVWTKSMIRAVLQGTYIRTKPGWTRVPWCIIKVMVAMFPNLAPGPGQLTLHWHCVALCCTGWFIVQGESWYTGWIMWPPYLVTSSRKWHTLPPGVCPRPRPRPSCHAPHPRVHARSQHRETGKWSSPLQSLHDTVLYWYKSSGRLVKLDHEIVGNVQSSKVDVKCTHQIVTRSR